MKKQRKNRFTSPSSAWTIVSGLGKGKNLEQYAREKRKRINK